jgi:flagellar basal-body rod modification protein FlgD
MMTTITQGPLGSAGPTVIPVATAATTAKGKNTLAKDDFLKLLVTQLRYQDPMNPSKPEEFAAQLAQFSSLESMQNIQDILTTQTQAGQVNTLAAKANLGTAMIGRSVLAAGDQLESSGSGANSVNVDLGAGGGTTTIEVLDSAGNTVLSKDMGWRASGRQVLTVGSLPAGEYTYKVTATSTSGADVAVQTYTQGVVDGISFSGGAVVLKSGKLTFPLDNVVEVEPAPAGAEAALAALRSARIIPSTPESVHP